MSGKRANYAEINKIVFTEEDVQKVLDAIREGEGSNKPIATLNLDNMEGGQITSGVLAAFEALAKVLKLPVTKTYAGLEIARPFSDRENREAAEQSLKYGYSTMSSAIRDQRAAEQGIEIYLPDEDKPES